ncbi:MULTISPECIES: hypothetical protein [Bacillus cereus group]|uniref:hypothetical protein n=1 Tax=Bacillus cereus group TaxID=86661 RepID=UPI000B44D4F7|nr:hypothetical protein [Bacillus thuringiensis]MEB9467802.1 hypothetical protein [Bacillus cereus]MRA82408.1 hypothetical protein [Bacillus thuringiensis]OUA16688.1 hypothetical protein BK776_30570 [Bacillus thuringiensis serovar aizawai]
MDTLTPVANNPIERMKQSMYKKIVNIVKQDHEHVHVDNLGNEGTYISKPTLWKVLETMQTIGHGSMYKKVNGVMNGENSMTITFEHEAFNYCDAQGKIFIGQTELTIHDNLLLRFYITKHYHVAIQIQYDVTTIVTMSFPPMI